MSKPNRMIVNEYRAPHCSTELNTNILRAVQKLILEYRNFIDDWSCCIEFQREDDDEPYYILRVAEPYLIHAKTEADHKVQTLRTFPIKPMTGKLTISEIIKFLNGEPGGNAVVNRLFSGGHSDRYDDLSENGKMELRDIYGITNGLGGIRIPYEILVTTHDHDDITSDNIDCNVMPVEGEIRIAFHGAEEEWQNVFFSVQLFGRIQEILNDLWTSDQILYDLNELREENTTAFWLKVSSVQESLL